MFFISGITGHVGGAAARKLLDEGHSVRALVRDRGKAEAWSARGVDVRAGDLGDAAALSTALEGVQGAFLMMPPQLTPTSRDFPEARALIASYRTALTRTPPPRLVVLSSIGSEQPKGLGPITTTHLLEVALRELALPTAFIRAGSFLENYAYAVGVAAATGRFDTYLAPTDKKVGVIATEDIGREVARRLTTHAWTGEKIIELGSLASPDDLARALGEVVGRAVTAHAIPRDQWHAGLVARGLTPLSAELFAEMEDGFNSRWISFGNDGAEHVEATVTPTAFFRGVSSPLRFQ